MAVSHVMQVNGDGACDVVVCSVDKGIGVILNDGNGHFGDIQWVDLNGFDGSSIYFASGDLDNDGDEDLVAVKSSTWVRVYINSGQGTFSTPQMVLSPVSTLRFLILADLDGDGVLDLLMNDQFDDQVLWYHGLGNGLFGLSAVSISTSDIVWSGCVADLDADGDNDLVGATNGLYGWAANDGGGTFGAWQTIGSATSEEEVRTADLDGDGDPDVLGITDGNTSLWWPNDGSGQFGPQQVIATSLDGLEANLVADLDGDGDLDVLPSGGLHSWYTNNGSGQFTLAQTITTADLGVCKLADVDADGDMDLLELNRQLSWYANDGNGGMGARTMIIANVYQSSVMRSADLDGDGDEDLVANSLGLGPRVMYYMNTGDGTFGIAQMACDTMSSQDVRVADIDNDGDADIAIMGYGHTIWLSNDGAAHFTYAQSFTTPSYPRQLVLEDMDGDGDRDMAYSDLNGDGVFLRLNDGTGLFGLEQTISGNFPSPEGVGACDVDTDGDLDLITCSQGTHAFVWFENNGSGSFSTEQLIWTPTYWIEMVDLECADVNGDGATDLVYFSPDLSGMVWRPNTGGGTFGAEVWLFQPEGVTTMTAAQDVDQDGDQDLFFGSYEPDIIYWVENDGSGSFSQPMMIDAMVTSAPRNIYARDLDLDGDLDLVTGLGASVQWYESFIDSPYQVQGAAFHDLDEDGVQDVGEGPLGFIPVHADPMASTVLADPGGAYTIFCDTGTYVVSVTFPNSWWGLTTDSASYHAELSTLDPISTGNDFGYAVLVDTTILVPGFTQGAALCGDTNMLWFNVMNQGTTNPSGTLCATVDTLYTFINSVPPPVSINGNTYCWTFDSLYFYSQYQVGIEVVMPDASSLGTQMVGSITVTEEDTLGAPVQVFTGAWGATVTCAFDPNDKQVSPAGYGDAGAVDIATEHVEYTIRFQNTGNAPATNVMLTDLFDPGLGLASLEVLGYSHTPTAMLIGPDGELVVRFDGIQLPDSGANFTGSQGFFRFGIDLLPGQPHGTLITNTASIFFDNNPPVITNTTHTTLVDCDLWEPTIVSSGWEALMATAGDSYQWYLDGLPVAGATEQLFFLTTNGSYTVEVTSEFGCVLLSDPFQLTTVSIEEQHELGIAVVPNPLTDQARLVFSEVLTPGHVVDVIDLQGRVLRTMKGSGTDQLMLDRAELASGLYLVRVTKEGVQQGSIRFVVQ